MSRLLNFFLTFGLRTLRNGCVHRYLGATNRHERLRCAMSTCGTFVLSGSEDGNVLVWNADTGKVSLELVCVRVCVCVCACVLRDHGQDCDHFTHFRHPLNTQKSSEQTSRECVGSFLKDNYGKKTFQKIAKFSLGEIITGIVYNASMCANSKQ